MTNFRYLPVVALAIALMTCALIWLPFGTGQGALVEEWGIMSVFVREGAVWWIPRDGAFPLHRLRPLTMAPFALAYNVSSEGFAAWHGLQALTLVLKGLGVAGLVHWCFRNSWLSLLAGVLFVVFPADTMQMALRNMHSNWAVALTVIGLTLFMWSTDLLRPAFRFLLAGAGSFIFLLGLFIYEGAVLLGAAPLVLWWARHGWQGMVHLRGHLVEAAMWVIALIVFFINVAYVLTTGVTYQTSVTGSGAAATFIQQLPELVTVGFYRVFVHGWIDGWRMLVANLPIIWPFAVAAVVLCALLLTQRQRTGRVPFTRPSGRWIIAGLILTALGYMPVLLSTFHTLITQRTFLFAPIGATIVIVVLIAYLRLRSRLAAGLVSTALILSGLGGQWEQMRFYLELSDRQAFLLSQLAGAMHDLEPWDQVAILDASGQMNYDWMIRGEGTRDALAYMFGHAVDLHICQVPSFETSTYVTDSQGIAGPCRREGDSWLFNIGTPWEREVVLPGARIIEVGTDGRVTSGPTGVPPDRVRRILGCYPCEIESNAQASYQFDFGRFWSMDVPPRGFGWAPPEWHAPAWDPDSFAWLARPEVRLLFELNPAAGAYRLDVDLHHGPDLPLTITVNDVAIGPDARTGDTITYTVPDGALRPGTNQLLFHRPVIDGEQSWFAISSVELQPR